MVSWDVLDSLRFLSEWMSISCLHVCFTWRLFYGESSLCRCSKEERIHGNIYYHIDREIHALPGNYKNETKDRNQTMSALIDWSHMSTADVFIMAKSAFSFVPALINPNCIIYHRFSHEPLDHWTVLPETANLTELHDLIDINTVPCISAVFLKKKNNNNKRFRLS